MTSILVRITGNALIVGALLSIWWLLSAATSPEYFAVADAVMTSWFGKLAMLGTIWAIWYHTLGGVRHLIWDNAVGLDLPTAYKLGWAVVIGSFVLTVLTVIVL
jgi:succinate dehydrogenase / fumarate reductase cytochrome b subunit